MRVRFLLGAPKTKNYGGYSTTVSTSDCGSDDSGSIPDSHPSYKKGLLRVRKSVILTLGNFAQFLIAWFILDSYVYNFIKFSYFD